MMLLVIQRTPADGVIDVAVVEEDGGLAMACW